MTTSSIHPRPNQIDELTRGIPLPLPKIIEVHLQFVVDTLHRAFNDLRVLDPATVNTGSEAEVTALLEARLNNLVRMDRRWGQLVSNVVRGKESLSYDGAHLEKRPDLSIYLTYRRGHANFPLIVEAKIIDKAHSKTAALYCDNGITRFVNGEYSWGNREAIMIAYVRDGSTIKAKLTPSLRRRMKRSPSGYLVLGLPKSRGAGAMDLATSQHGRRFNYIGRSPPDDQPGTISVWHLWLT